MAKGGSGKAAAFDAGVYAESDLQQTKAASAVDYFERELAKAEDAVSRVEGKVERQERHLESAQQSLRDAEAERDSLQAELDNARSQLEELVNAEVQ
jgi:septal ring factor EnvC (AmiA/AmiB activator)